MSKIVDNIGLPTPVLEAIKNRPYDKGDADISITGLQTPPRITQLLDRLGDEVEQEAADLIYALEGSAMHSVFEWASSTMDSDNFHFEKRLFAEIDGWKVSGQMDLIDLQQKLIQDYKRCSYWVGVYGIKEEWTQQLNGYRWLCHKNGIDIERLEICAVYRDWSKEKAWRGERGYPQKGIEIFHIDVWPLDRAEAWIKERVAIHQKAILTATSKLPLCTPEERWEKKGQFAVEVKGEKKARKLEATRQDALNWMAEHLQPSDISKATVIQRDGYPKRCIGWCPVRKQCSFGKGWAK